MSDKNEKIEIPWWACEKWSQGISWIQKKTSQNIVWEVGEQPSKTYISPISHIIDYARGKEKTAYATSVVDLWREYIWWQVPLEHQDILRDKLYNHILSWGYYLLIDIERWKKRMIVMHDQTYVDLTPMTNMRYSFDTSVINLEDIYNVDQHKTQATIMELWMWEWNVLHTISALWKQPKQRKYIWIDQCTPKSYEQREDGISFMQFDLDDPDIYTFLPKADLIYSDYTGQYIENILILLQHLPDCLYDWWVAKINVWQTDRFSPELLHFLLSNDPEVFSLSEWKANNLYNTLNQKLTKMVVNYKTLYFTFKKWESPPLVLPKKYFASKWVSFSLPQEWRKDIIAIPPHWEKMWKYSLDNS